ncbi:cyclic GMP-AMP synthase-like [Branchiostoma lanceolatum]|uniref:cyclic GMP-AMP synthase-like n=1 Tax=Branchiostoma lanceolatum TaxID=7740 RepID=UPI003454EA0B
MSQLVSKRKRKTHGTERVTMATKVRFWDKPSSVKKRTSTSLGILTKRPIRRTGSESYLDQYIRTYYKSKLEIPCSAILSVRQSVADVLGALSPLVQENEYSMAIGDFVCVGSGYDGMKNGIPDEFDVVVPFRLGPKCSETRRPATDYVCVRSRRGSKNAGKDTWSGCRTGEGYISPIKVTKRLQKIVLKALEETGLPNVIIHPDCRNALGGERVGVRLSTEDGVTIRLLPALGTVDQLEPFLVAISYRDDPDYTLSDYYWRRCFCVEEGKVVRYLSQADGGRRIKVLQVMKHAFRKDAMLRHLSDYAMKTALMHMFDQHIDEDDWHAYSFAACFMEMLRLLHGYLKRQSLPHFYMDDVNVLRNVPEPRLVSMTGKVESLLASEQERTRLLRAQFPVTMSL